MTDDTSIPIRAVAWWRRVLVWATADRGALTLVGVVTLLALGLRLWHLDTEPLHVDEIRQVTEVQDTWIRVIRASYGAQQPPLDYLIGKAVVTVLPATDFVQRLPAALFGTGTVWLVGFVLVRAGHAAAAPVAALFVAISPLHVELSQYARPYALPVFMVVATIAVYQRWHRGKTGWRSVLLFASMAALALLSRASMPMLALGILGGVALITALQRSERFDPVRLVRSDPLALLVLPVLFVLVWIPSALRITTGTDNLSECITCDKWAKAAQAVENFGTFGERAMRPTSLVWLLVGVGLVLLWRSARQALARSADIWAPLLLTAPAFAVLHAVALPRNELFAHRFMVFLPVGLAVYLSIAVAAIIRDRTGTSRRVALLAVAVIASITAAEMLSAVRAQARELDLADWRATAEYIEQIEQPGDVIVSIDTRPFSAESKFGFRAAPRYYEGTSPYWTPEQVAGDPSRGAAADRYHFVLFVPKMAEAWSLPEGWVVADFSEMKIATSPALDGDTARVEAWWDLTVALRPDVAVAAQIAAGAVQETLGLELHPFFDTAMNTAESIGRGELAEQRIAERGS